jgi:AcrR family transcriptional regulator
MSDVVAAAGVARATVYRYFPNRQSLLDELANLAVRQQGIGSPRRGSTKKPVLDGISRAIRALVEVGDGFIVPRADGERF